MENYNKPIGLHNFIRQTNAPIPFEDIQLAKRLEVFLKTDKISYEDRVILAELVDFLCKQYPLYLIASVNSNDWALLKLIAKFILNLHQFESDNKETDFFQNPIAQICCHFSQQTRDYLEKILYGNQDTDSPGLLGEKLKLKKYINPFNLSNNFEQKNPEQTAISKITLALIKGQKVTNKTIEAALSNSQEKTKPNLRLIQPDEDQD